MGRQKAGEEHRGRLRATHLEGPADVVVEIVSPDSRERDRYEKYREYEAGGVCEYWIIDPIEEQVASTVRQPGIVEPLSPLLRLA